MASLTGQQINNSYSGLLKTEDNGLIGIGRTAITDGVGTPTGLFLWKQYGLHGIDNAYDTTQVPQWIISNDNWNTASWPQASGLVTLSFGDFDEFKTYDITQNRFGSVTYKTYAPSQSHIFTGAAGNDGVIRINTFNSVNNSNSWYTGYQNSVDSLAYNSGTGDLTLGRTDNTDLVVNIPSGGGGGTYSFRQDQYLTPGAYDAGIGSTYSFFNNVVIFQPIQLPSGTLSEIAIQVEVTSATANDTRLVLYSAGGTSTNQHPYGAPSQLVADLGIIDTSVGGLVQLSTSITVEEGLYYYGVYQEGTWDAAFRVYDAGTGATNRAHQNWVSADTITNSPSTLYNAFYSTVGAGWVPPATYTGGFSSSSDRTSMYFKIS